MTGVHLWYWVDVAAWHAKRTKAAAGAKRA
jgi:hypothetical protein